MFSLVRLILVAVIMHGSRRFQTTDCWITLSVMMNCRKGGARDG
jgi:hypothetical protein